MTLAGIRIKELLAEVLREYRQKTGDELKVRAWELRFQELFKQQEREEYLNELHGAN